MVGEYQILRHVATGGMGSVYEAVHPVIEKRAAVKVVRSDLSANPIATTRFVQEARAVNKIGHANIVDIFSFGETDEGLIYLVMEWLDGETLAQRLKATKLTTNETVTILLQICRALSATHAHGIIHRDLKPDNVVLTEGDHGVVVKLLDFGIAKLGDAPVRGDGLTGGGVMIGTPEYMSPEQARGLEIDARADIYALGAMAYEMFLGSVPFDGATALDIVSKHLHEDPRVPRELWPDIPSPLEEILVSTMAKDPEQRPVLDDVIAKLRLVRAMYGPAGKQPRRGLDGLPSPYPRAPTPPHIAPQGSGRATMAEAATIRQPTADLIETDRIPVVTRRLPRWLLLFIAAAGACVVALVSTRSASLPSERSQVESNAPVTLTITTDADDSLITVDGRIAARAARHTQIAVPPGRHQLIITAPGRLPHRQNVDLRDNLSIDVELAPVPTPTEPSKKAEEPTKRSSDKATRAREARRKARRRARRKQRQAQRRRATKAPHDPDGTINPFSE